MFSVVFAAAGLAIALVGLPLATIRRSPREFLFFAFWAWMCGLTSWPPSREKDQLMLTAIVRMIGCVATLIGVVAVLLDEGKTHDSEAEQPTPISCPHCGRLNSGGATTCSRCGQSL